MGAHDSLAATLPCPGCGDLHREELQLPFFVPDYHTAAWLKPGGGRALDFDPAVIDASDLWEGQWLRMGEIVRPGAVSILFDNVGAQICECGRALIPLAHFVFRTTGPDAGEMTLVALELCDPRRSEDLERIDFIDLDWFFFTVDPRNKYAFDLDALVARSRADRRAALAAEATRWRDAWATSRDEKGDTWLAGPTRCEACGQTRSTRDLFFIVSHPSDVPFFGEAWPGRTITIGTRVQPVPPELDTDLLRGRFYRLRAPITGELVLLSARPWRGCRCGTGWASTLARFARDGDGIVLRELCWRVIRSRADLADVDWLELPGPASTIDELDRETVIASILPRHT